MRCCWPKLHQLSGHHRPNFHCKVQPLEVAGKGLEVALAILHDTPQLLKAAVARHASELGNLLKAPFRLLAPRPMRSHACRWHHQHRSAAQQKEQHPKGASNGWGPVKALNAVQQHQRHWVSQDVLEATHEAGVLAHVLPRREAKSRLRATSESTTFPRLPRIERAAITNQ